MNFKKIFYTIVGCISFVIGAVGTVVPMLPTVPLLMLSAFCFTRSSEKLNHWFIHTKLYKNNLESYVQGRGMTLLTKLRIMGTVTVLMTFGFIMMKNSPVGQTILFCVWILHIIYFVRGVKTLKESPDIELTK
ncbi:MAG: YbaN family protein [Brotaphodocola sp.]